MADKVTKNVCQHWVKEPPICKNWDQSSRKCTLATASKYPLCNRVGTAVDCTKYEGTGKDKEICVAPDPSRHIGPRKTKSKSVPNWTPDILSGYNDGKCDGSGTTTTCSGYSPHHMAFSTVAADKKPFSADEDNLDTTSTDKLDFRLPIYYDVCYGRAILGRCYWWKSAASYFSIDQDTGEIADVPSQCENKDEAVKEYWDKHVLDKELGIYRAPCNGAKPECPGYTGICWKYCIDEKMRQGDKVLADQIQELRYYLKKDQWTDELFKNTFNDPVINAWAGSMEFKQDSDKTLSKSNENEKGWLIDVYKISIPEFDKFTIKRVKDVLTAGTPANDYKGEYPTLVREIVAQQHVPPLIRNKFDKDSTSGNHVFETADLDNEDILIYGDTFYYDSYVYGFNFDDPAVKNTLPSELLKYESMLDIENAKGDKFTEWYQDFAGKFEKLLDMHPEIFIPSVPAGKDGSFFYMGIPTNFGTNNLFVITEGSGRWEYDKIRLTKSYCGAIIAQTSFNVGGTGTVNRLPDYAYSFNGTFNNNVSAQFKLVRFGSATTEDFSVFDDTVRQRLPINPDNLESGNTYDMSYRLYKREFKNIKVKSDDLIILGNSGRIVVHFPKYKKYLQALIKGMEINENVNIVYPDKSKCKMKLIEAGTSRIENDQIVLEPVDITKFKPLCHDPDTSKKEEDKQEAYIEFKSIVVYEKHSFGEYPSGEGDTEEVIESFINEEDDVVMYNDYIEKSQSTSSFTLNNISADPVCPSVIFRSSTSRPKGLAKTKLITWVKQPFCRDVEIGYTWTAGYTHYVLQPERECFFKELANPSMEYDGETYFESYGAQCGDHDLSGFSGKGSMWYPYDVCADSANYNFNGPLSEWDVSLMEVFKPGEDPETGESTPPEHGAWDMRMLGPADHFGFTCGVHASLYDCMCDWSFCNRDKITENIFDGFARYRGGLGGLEKERALRYGGSLPKFGNTYRDFFRSYRSVDVVDYYYIDPSSGDLKRSSKWVPAYEYWTNYNLTGNTGQHPFLLYNSGDYYSDGSSFIHPLGLFKVSSIDGVDINEYYDDEEYTFDELFYVRSSTAGLYYPYPKKPYIIGGAVPKTLISWYTYKDPKTGSGSESIQWAWQGYWREASRGPVEYSLTIQTYKFLGSHQISNLTGSEEKITPSPYDDQSGLVGRHLFLNIGYPEYKYDAELKEYRLVCEAGDYEIIITPPDAEDGDGNYDSDNAKWSVKINEDGPARCFNLAGSWTDDSGDCNESLYKTCTVDPWYSDVTLFVDGASTSPDSDRTVVTYDLNGDEVENYYNYGLDIDIKPEMLKYLPYVIKPLPQDGINMRLSRVPDIESTESESGALVNVEKDSWFPSQGSLNFKYKFSEISNFSLNVDFDLGKDKGKAVLAAVIEFDYGSEADATAPENDQEGVIFVGDLYHIPGLAFLSSSDDVSYQSMFSLNSVELSTKNTKMSTYKLFYENETAVSSIINNSDRYFRISFRLDTTEAELESKGDLYKYYDESYVNNICHIKSIQLYYGVLEEAKESIKTYERKYDVTLGSHGDFCPHGTGGSSLLYPLKYDKSTVYQFDSLNGVAGVPNSAGDLKTMNKVRGRIMKECHENKEDVSGNDIYVFEAEQKKIYDDLIKLGSNNFTVKGELPKSFKKRLSDIGILSSESWTCTFTNNYVRPLSPIIQQETYSPCGHNFDWDLENMKLSGPCGSKPWFNVLEFEYVFRRVCGDHATGAVDALELYGSALGRVLSGDMFGPPVPVFGDYAGGNQTYEDSVNMTFPPDVLILY